MDFSSPGTTEWLVIAGAVVLLLLVVRGVATAARRRRRAALRERYGPEYDRTVRARGGDRAARTDLSEREQERERLRLRDLDRAEKEAFGRRMAQLQYRFAEDPAGAVYEAGRVAADALRARGYPVTEDRDRALGLVALDHPEGAQPLRTAIEGTYGKDLGRLRDTFIGVRDSLRDILGIHYGVDDSGVAAAPPAGAVAAAGRVPASATPRHDEAAAAGRDEASAADRGDAAPGDDTATADRTVRVDEDPAADEQRPVGAVPPPPGAERSG